MSGDPFDPDGTISFSFDFTEAATRDATAHDAIRTKKTVRQRVVPQWLWGTASWTAIIVLCFGAVGLARGGQPQLFAGVLGLVAGLVGAGVYAKILNTRYIRRKTEEDGAIPTQKATISAAGITSELPGIMVRRDWSTVIEIVALPNSTGVVLDSGTLAIDDSFLPAGLHKDAFVAAMQTWRKAA